MKKLACLFISVMLMASMCACGFGKQKIQEPVNFYYCTNPEAYQSGSDVFSTEVREAAGHSDYVSLLNLYLRGPLSEQLVSPFPAGIAVEELTLENITAKIRLNSQFSKLTGVDLILACAGLSMTIFDLTDVQYAEFCVADGLLDGRETISLSRDDFFFNDDNTIPSSAK